MITKKEVKWDIELTADGHRLAYIYVGHHYKIIFRYDGKIISLKCVLANRTRLFKFTEDHHDLKKKSVLDEILRMQCLPGIDNDAFYWVTTGIIASTYYIDA